MSMSSTIQELIAHYLALNYPSVVEPFISAAHIAPPDPSNPPRPDLRTVIEDYLSQQLASELDAVVIDGEAPAQDGSWDNWRLPHLMKLSLEPSIHLGGVRRSIEGVSATNLLTVFVALIPRRSFDTAVAAYKVEYRRTIITSAVDKSLSFIDYESGEVDRILQPHNAAVLSFCVHPINPRYIVSGSMDGTTVLTDLITQQALQTFRSSRFVVRTVFSPDGRYLATASYDKTIVIYAATASCEAPEVDEDTVPLDETDDANLECEPSLRYEPVHTIKVESNPEAIVFHPDNNWLLYTLRSSHLLHYVSLDGGFATKTKSFNPHPMDSHVSFSVLNLAIHPSGKMIAAQTGDHRGGTSERILLYGIEPEETERLACLWTGTESDDFVLPRMAWLPDGTGLVTTSPNGYLNLVSVSGEVRSSVKIHGAMNLGQASSEVVRDCCVIEKDGEWEVISVGYDRQVRISR